MFSLCSCLALCSCFVSAFLALWSPRLGKREHVYLCASRAFVSFFFFAHVNFCRFSLPLDVRDWLWFVIVTLLWTFLLTFFQCNVPDIIFVSLYYCFCTECFIAGLLKTPHRPYISLMKTLTSCFFFLNFIKDDQISHVMRLWYFSSSVNSFFKCACAATKWG